MNVLAPIPKCMAGVGLHETTKGATLSHTVLANETKNDNTGNVSLQAVLTTVCMYA